MRPGKSTHFHFGTNFTSVRWPRTPSPSRPALSTIRWLLSTEGKSPSIPVSFAFFPCFSVRRYSCQRLFPFNIATAIITYVTLLDSREPFQYRVVFHWNYLKRRVRSIEEMFVKFSFWDSCIRKIGYLWNVFGILTFGKTDLWQKYCEISHWEKCTFGISALWKSAWTFYNSSHVKKFQLSRSNFGMKIDWNHHGASKSDKRTKSCSECSTSHGSHGKVLDYAK